MLEIVCLYSLQLVHGETVGGRKRVVLRYFGCPGRAGSAWYDVSMSGFEERRRLRRNWPGRTFALGAEPAWDDRSPATIDERIALVWELTLEAWQVAGKTLPTFDRVDSPGRLLRAKRCP